MSALPEVLPDEFVDKLALLESILEKGMGKLLAEVRGKGFAQEPFGRKPDPTPLMSEEDFLDCDATNEPVGVNDDPVFNFEYGFNPMSFLGKFVKWSHPNSVVERKANKSRCMERLQARARHALEQLHTFQSLIETVNQQGSMVLWGPISSSLSPSDVVILFHPLVFGKYTIDISVNSKFSELFETKTVEVSPVVPLAPMDIVLSNLKPASKYYVRVYLEGNNEEVNDENNVKSDEDGDKTKERSLGAADEVGENVIDGGSSENIVGEAATPVVGIQDQEPLAQSCSFWTLPSDESGDSDGVGAAATPSPQNEEEDAVDSDGTKVGGDKDNFLQEKLHVCSPVSLTCVHADISPSTFFAMEGVSQELDAPMLTCLVGDPVAAPEGAVAIEEESYKVDLWRLHTKHPVLNNPSSLLRNTSLYFAWNDSRFGSDVDIRAEEVAYKRYTHDLKKHTKKYGSGGKKANSKAPPPPVLSRPQISSSLVSLTSAFPLHYNADGSATRSLYRSVMLGPFIELILLDLRNGYMCKEQAKWLKETVGNSSAMWKIIVSGLPTASEASPRSGDDAPGHMTASRNRSRTPSNLQALDATDDDGGNVRVHVPEKELEKDDCDELGRPKNSLSYILFSLHRSFERKKAIAATETETVEDEDGSVIDSVAASRANAEVEAESAAHSSVIASESAEIEAGLDNIELEGGIILVSSNPTAAFGSAPFISTFDPAETGKAFCAEVNLGSATTSSMNNLRHMAPHLNTQYIQEENLSASAGGQMVVLNLTGEGALAISLKTSSGVVTASQTFTTVPNDASENDVE